MDRNKKSRISQNTWNKILSVFLAIVLWTVVIGGENPIKDRTIHAVPVELKNLDSLADHNLAIAGHETYTGNRRLAAANGVEIISHDRLLLPLSLIT